MAQSLQPSACASSSSLLLEPDDAGLEEAAALLRSGKLVAFPTETVYGLGANALDAEAVLDIFRAKGRPLTDPLIVHIAQVSDADSLIDVPDSVRAVFKALATRFWPGPLTIIVKASQRIPLAVTANTGYVGIRCPKHSLARDLIARAGVPIAAPSANRFGHVSPTRAQHVLDDLADKGVVVLHGESPLVSLGDTTCEFGIESTVVKLNMETREVWIYRQGAVTQSQLEASLQPMDQPWTVKPVQRTVAMHSSQSKVEESTTVGEEAPGQAVTHYAPDVQCLMVKSMTWNESPSPDAGDVVRLSAQALSGGVVVIDFAGQFAGRASSFLAYRDLSARGSSLEAAQGLFDTLRWAEQVAGAQMVLVAPIVQKLVAENVREGEAAAEAQDLTLGLVDRVYRAASGVAAHVAIEG